MTAASRRRRLGIPITKSPGLNSTDLAKLSDGLFISSALLYATSAGIWLASLMRPSTVLVVIEHVAEAA